MTVHDQPLEDAEPEEVRSTDNQDTEEELLEEALREKEQFRAMAQRAQADLENYKKRAIVEVSETRRVATSQLLLKMLSITDDLGRAILHIPGNAVASDWLDGLKLVIRSIDALLESEGVLKIEALGLSFDPREAEAVQYEETLEVEDGKVVSVIREGYKHHDKVLRAAQVIVAKAPEVAENNELIEEEQQDG